MNKDPTEKFQKQIQKAITQCTDIIEKTKHKYIINMKPTTPQLKANIKTHKEGMPIRPVINNINAPAYNLAKLLNKQMHILLPLPNTYTVKNSNEIAQEIIKIPINEQTRMITLDIKDMYVNLPTEGILRAAKTSLQKTTYSLEMNKQIMILLSIIM